ncbi:endonuclease/exonuclease/phosphatase family protein [Sphingobacterium olei]|nr:endonuclease/exonuclease/phosphatase family protein [Sphingobacterium olei]
MSFNIRMNYQDDGINNWEHRRVYMTDFIKRYQPDLLGIQEAYYPQYVDMKDLLPDYDSFGPVEGRQGAESVAAFYRKNQLTCLDSGTFWLSETPEEQSVGWDANLRRTVTWGAFQIKSNGQKVYLFVTHFDHKGKKAIEESAKLLLQKIEDIAGDNQAFITGDFNFTEESPYYKILTTKQDITKPLYDTSKLAQNYLGPAWTLHNFGLMPIEKRSKIDYIFSNKRIPVVRFENIDEHRGDLYPSDHNPLMITVKIEP